MSAVIDFIGTEKYFEEVVDPEGTMENISNFCESVWEDEIDRDAGFITNSQSQVEIPEETMPEPAWDIGERAEFGGDWLDENWGYYDYTHAIIILDYWDEPDYPAYGQVVEIGSANTANPKSAGVNMYATPDGDSWYRDVGLQGVSFHELLHLFNAEHYDALRLTNDGKWTIMGGATDDYAGNCASDYRIDRLTDVASGCSTDEVEDHYDSNT